MYGLRRRSRRRASALANSTIRSINMQMKKKTGLATRRRIMSATEEYSRKKSVGKRQEAQRVSTRKTKSLSVSSMSDVLVMPKRSPRFAAKSPQPQPTSPSLLTTIPRPKRQHVVSPELKCTCYDPPLCPVHHTPPKTIMAPFFTIPTSPITCSTKLSMAMDSLPHGTSANSSTTAVAGTTLSLPAIFQGHLLIPQQFANSLDQVIAAVPCAEIHHRVGTARVFCDHHIAEESLSSDDNPPDEPVPPASDEKINKQSPKEELTGQLIISSNWKPVGQPEKRWVYMNNDEKPQRRPCYTEIVHKTESDSVVRLRDCVVVNSGDADRFFVAKVGEFFEDPKTKTLWASIVWYYWPDQTDLTSRDEQIPSWCDHKELFASRHVDVVPVDTIEDVVYVLTLNEYNRYCAENLFDNLWPSRREMVPRAMNSYRRRRLMPTEDCDDSNVYFCRRVYDYFRKRLIVDPN